MSIPSSSETFFFALQTEMNENLFGAFSCSKGEGIWYLDIGSKSLLFLVNAVENGPGSFWRFDITDESIEAYMKDEVGYNPLDSDLSSFAHHFAVALKSIDDFTLDKDCGCCLKLQYNFLSTSGTSLIGSLTLRRVQEYVSKEILSMMKAIIRSKIAIKTSTEAAPIAGRHEEMRPSSSETKREDEMASSAIITTAEDRKHKRQKSMKTTLVGGFSINPKHRVIQR